MTNQAVATSPVTREKSFVNRCSVASTDSEDASTKRHRQKIVTPQKSPPSKRSKLAPLKKFQQAIEDNQESLKKNADQWTAAIGKHSEILKYFDTFHDEFADLMKGNYGKSLLDIASDYNKNNKQIFSNLSKVKRLVERRNSVLNNIKPMANAAANEINDQVKWWIDQYNKYILLKYIEEQPTPLLQLPTIMSDHVHNFTNALSKMEGDNFSVAKLGGIIETFQDALAKSTDPLIQKLLEKIQQRIKAKDTPEQICYWLVDGDETTHDAIRIKELMKRQLTDPRDLHKIAQKDSFRIIHVFKDGDKSAYIYHERRVIEDYPKDVLLSIDSSMILYASKYLCCAAVIGDFDTFAEQVSETLGLSEGNVLHGVYEHSL